MTILTENQLNKSKEFGMIDTCCIHISLNWTVENIDDSLVSIVAADGFILLG